MYTRTPGGLSRILSLCLEYVTLRFSGLRIGISLSPIWSVAWLALILLSFFKTTAVGSVSTPSTCYCELRSLSLSLSSVGRRCRCRTPSDRSAQPDPFGPTGPASGAGRSSSNSRGKLRVGRGRAKQRQQGEPRRFSSVFVWSTSADPLKDRADAVQHLRLFP